jgi:hypothetical protein
MLPPSRTVQSEQRVEHQSAPEILSKNFYDKSYSKVSMLYLPEVQRCHHEQHLSLRPPFRFPLSSDGSSIRISCKQVSNSSTYFLFCSVSWDMMLVSRWIHSSAVSFSRRRRVSPRCETHTYSHILMKLFDVVRRILCNCFLNLQAPWHAPNAPLKKD